MRAVLAILLAALVAGCGVPTPPDAGTLAAAARGGDRAAVAELVGLLGRDQPPERRVEAYKVLLELGAGAAAEVLAACRSKDPVRREHALALAANGRLPEAHAEAVGALRDAAFPRRYVAAWALGELGDPAAVPELIAALQTGNEGVAREASRSLIKLGVVSVPPVVAAMERLEGAALGYAVRVLGEVKAPAALPALERALRQPAVRADAAWALGQVGLKAGVAVLLDHLEDPDWRVRLEVARSLGLLEAAEAGAYLARARGDDPALAVRETAARALALLSGTPETYRDDQDQWVIPKSYYH